MLLAACLADKTLRGALLAGTDSGSLVGVVSAEAVALMERAIKSMTNAKLTQVATAALIAGLLTAGACVMGFSWAREKNPARSSELGQEARQGATAAPVVEGPSRSPAAKPAAVQGTIALQVEVTDSAGRRLSGADVAVTLWYARSAGSLEPVVKRLNTDGTGNAQLELARAAPGRESTPQISGSTSPGVRSRRRMSRSPEMRIPSWFS